MTARKDRYVHTQRQYGDMNLWIAEFINRKANETNPNGNDLLKPHPNQREMLYEAYLVLLHHQNIVHKQIQYQSKKLFVTDIN